MDQNFEPNFFSFRYLIVVPVILSFIGLIAMFIVGGYYTAVSVFRLLHYHFTHITTPIIKAVDNFLLGLVLIIFSFGVYDLFVSKLEPAKKAGIRPHWLKFDDVASSKMCL